MPEGPEVLKFANSLGEAAPDKNIHSVEILSGRYMRTKPDLSRLIGARIRGVSARGKLITFLVSDETVDRFGIMSTLGLTGEWLVNPHEKATKHIRIRITLNDGTRLCFADQRNFGTFKIAEAAEMRRKLAELGPDIMWPLEHYKTLVEPLLKERIRRFGTDMNVAEATLDQRFFAGCGNYIRADAMYLARISPHRKLYRLQDHELYLLWCSMNSIAKASMDGYHPITGRPDPFENLCYGRERSVDDHPVYRYEDRNGRTVHWSPSHQV